MYEKILERFIRSDDMLTYLKTKNIADHSIATIICSSPCPINNKIIGLKELREFAIKINNSNLIGYIDKALNIYNKCMEYKDNPDGIFTVEECIYNTNINCMNENLRTVCYDFDSIIDFISENTICENDSLWFRVIKWINNTDDGKLQEASQYIFVNKEIYYCDIYSDGYIFDDLFDPAACLSLETPFSPGDILEIDNFPFAPKSYVLVLDTSDSYHMKVLAYDLNYSNWQVRYIDDDELGLHIYPVPDPLFSAKVYNGDLTDELSFIAYIHDCMINNPVNIDNISKELQSRWVISCEDVDNIMRNGFSIKDN